VSLEDDVRAELKQLEAIGRLRVPRVVDGRQGPRITLDGAEVLDVASNDYLSLAGDPRIVDAAKASLDEDGFGAGASRLIVGNHRRHVVLERAIAEWMRVGAVRLFGSGYAANTGTIAALVQPGDVVFSDELNHASIIDGCRLARAEVVVFPHRNLGILDEELRERAGRRRVVISETLFSMDGDIADVEGLAAIAKRHGAALMLDEAHAIGARGPEGRGIAAALGIVPDVLVGTCGKALGAYGAFVATSASISQLLWNRARSLVFSTALPAMVSAAVHASIEIVRSSEGDDRRARLAARATQLRARVRDLGGHVDSAIAPLVIGDDRRVMEISSALYERRVFVQGIRYPTVPEGTARLRLSLNAGHTSQDVEMLAIALNDATSQLE
jgi:8-amino-7-oxononanoate synthase